MRFLLQLSLLLLAPVGGGLCFSVVHRAANGLPWPEALALYAVCGLACFAIGSVTSWTIIHVGQSRRRR